MPTVILHSWIARTATVGLGALCALMSVLGLLSAGPRTAIEVLAWGAVMTWACALLWWMPQIRLETRALTVRNAWRTWVLPWQRVERCAGRWGLELVLDDGRQVSAAAAPRGGGIAAGLRYHAQHRERLSHSEATRGRGGAMRTSGRMTHLLGQPVARTEFVTPGKGTYRLRLDSAAAMDLIDLYRAQVLDLDTPMTSGEAEGVHGAAELEPGEVRVRVNREVVVATLLTALLVLGGILLRGVLPS